MTNLLVTLGAVAQLGERSVRNAEVEGSIPFRSTRYKFRRILDLGYPSASEGAASEGEEKRHW